MEITIRNIDAALLPAFRPYLLPEAAERLAAEEAVAVGAVTEDLHTCGAAAALTGVEGAALASLYIDPQVRRQGVAKRLLDELETAVGPLTEAGWSLPEPDFSGMDALLQKRGFIPAVRAPDASIRLSVADVRKNPMVRRAFLPDFRPADGIVPVSAFTEAERRELCTDETIPATLRLDAFTEEQLSLPTCLGCRYGGRIVAYFLSEPTADGAAVLAAVSRKDAHAAAFFQLASAAIHQYLPGLSVDGGFWLEAVSREAETLMRYLGGGNHRLWYTGTTRKP